MPCFSWQDLQVFFENLMICGDVIRALAWQKMLTPSCPNGFNDRVTLTDLLMQTLLGMLSALSQGQSSKPGLTPVPQLVLCATAVMLTDNLCCKIVQIQQALSMRGSSLLTLAKPSKMLANI